MDNKSEKLEKLEEREKLIDEAKAEDKILMFRTPLDSEIQRLVTNSAVAFFRPKDDKVIQVYGISKPEHPPYSTQNNGDFYPVGFCGLSHWKYLTRGIGFAWGSPEWDNLPPQETSLLPEYFQTLYRISPEGHMDKDLCSAKFEDAPLKELCDTLDQEGIRLVWVEFPNLLIGYRKKYCEESRYWGQRLWNLTFGGVLEDVQRADIRSLRNLEKETLDAVSFEIKRIGIRNFHIDKSLRNAYKNFKEFYGGFGEK